MAKVLSRAQGLAGAIKGSTKAKETIPKAKHVEFIQRYLSQNHEPQVLRECLMQLSKRLADDSPVVALKARLLLHTHILSDNNRTLTKYTLLDFIKNDTATTVKTVLPTPQLSQSLPQHRLLLAYSTYLSQRISDYEALALDPIREKADKSSIVDHISSTTKSRRLLDQAQRVLGQIKLVLECFFTPEMLANSLYRCCYTLLAYDIALLFSFLNQGLVHALQNFFSLARPDAERTLFIYKEYTQLQITDEVMTFINLSQNHVDPNDMVVPSALQQSPEAIDQMTRALESYLFKDVHNNRNSAAPSVSTTTSRAATVTSSRLDPGHSPRQDLHQAKFNPIEIRPRELPTTFVRPADKTPSSDRQTKWTSFDFTGSGASSAEPAYSLDPRSTGPAEPQQPVVSSRKYISLAIDTSLQHTPRSIVSRASSSSSLSSFDSGHRSSEGTLFSSARPQVPFKLTASMVTPISATSTLDSDPQWSDMFDSLATSKLPSLDFDHQISVPDFSPYTNPDDSAPRRPSLFRSLRKNSVPNI